MRAIEYFFSLYTAKHSSLCVQPRIINLHLYSASDQHISFTCLLQYEDEI